MGEVVEFKRPETPKAKKKSGRRGDTLCRNGHHKWQIWKQKQFEVKQGRLVTVFRCEYCGETKTKPL